MKASRLMKGMGRIAILVLAMSAASAQTPLASEQRSADAILTIGADVGSGWNILSIPAAAFIPLNSSTTWTFGGNGYIWAGGAGGSFWAPVFLPSGAGVGLIGLYAYDSDPANDIVARLRRFTGYGDRICQFPPLCPPDIPPAASDVTLVTYTGSAGYVYRESAVLNPLHTVNNNTAYDFGAQYTVMVTRGAVGSMLQFKGVDIWWKRQISPPPGTASFTDVPTNAQFFAEIEAMKESGITTGCTANEFCPDLAVTRRQMAAFFARALGLYWQY